MEPRRRLKDDEPVSSTLHHANRPTVLAAHRVFPPERPNGGLDRPSQPDPDDADEKDRTYVRKDSAEVAHFKFGPVGEADLDEQQPITFEVGGKHLTLPVSETLTVGRTVKRPFTKQPDVNLGSFESQHKSVSRLHIQLRRQGTLVYVADLGSRNGTWLNGHRLLKNGERLLRNGDELQLGNLKIRVKYYSYPNPK
jgi:hypothetical protein